MLYTIDCVGNKFSFKFNLVGHIWKRKFIYIVYQNYWDGSPNRLVDPQIEYPIRRFTIAMSWFALIIKIGLIYYTYLLSGHFKTQDTRTEPFKSDLQHHLDDLNKS